MIDPQKKLRMAGKIFIGYLLSILLLRPAQAQQQLMGFQMDPTLNKVTLPFELLSNLMVIEVTLNDQLPLKFVLDSGVRTPILTDKYFTDIIRVSYAREVELFSAGAQGTAIAYVANEVSISVPGIRADDQSIFVLKEDFLGLSEVLGEKVHGLIGYDFFNGFVVSIDYPNHEVTFTRQDKFRAPRFSEEIPLQIESSKPYVNLEVLMPTGKTEVLKLMVDTGASHALWLDPPADTTQSILPEKTFFTPVGRGLSGDIDGYLGRVDLIKIDRYGFENVLSSFPLRTEYQEVLQSTGRDGSIGSEILRRFDISFDYANNRMFVLRNPNYNDDFDYNMSGLSIVRDIQTSMPRYVVNKVEDGSPAAKAGLKVGDVIVKLNGTNERQLSLNQINYLLKSREGRRIRITIRREGKEIEKEFHLQSLI